MLEVFAEHGIPNKISVTVVLISHLLTLLHFVQTLAYHSLLVAHITISLCLLNIVSEQ